jgi:hypothetical protein
MEMQALTRAMEVLAATQRSLSVLVTLETIFLGALCVLLVGGLVWLWFELRTLRHMLLHVQTSAEHIAEMTRDVLRRVSG